jgi:hypothetical protein
MAITSIFDCPTGPFAAFVPTGPVAMPAPQPRVRMLDDLDPQLRVWLTRCSRVHAALSGLVRTYACPDRAGGQSLAGDDHVERARRGCKTLLFDALTYCNAELDAIRTEVATKMEAGPPTHHPPGTGLKVEAMRQRFEQGNALFQSGDAAPSTD